MQGIYKIINKVNGKYYVGSTKYDEARWHEHREGLRTEHHYNPYLQRAWNKYGEENFEFKFVEKIENEDDLHPTEQIYLDEGFELGLLYNIARKVGGGAVRGIGWRHTEDAKAQMGISQKKSWTLERRKKQSEQMTGVIGERHPAYGTHRNEEWKCRQSERVSGKGNPMYGNHRTEEWRKGQSERLSGKNNPMFGRTGKESPSYGTHHSKETNLKIGEGVSKPYPAFYNVETGESILAGRNLTKLCREQNLSWCVLYDLQRGVRKQSKNGWRLA